MERLNKVLAHAGLGSRRQCEALIAAGRIRVDGQVVTDLGHKIEPSQEITIDGHPIREQRKVYWLVNKPKGYLSTNYDPGHRPRVIDLVPHVSERVYTVGRLDEASEGLVLLTNDGELAQRLTHPRYGVEKTYVVQVAGLPSEKDLRKLLQGVWISDGKVHARRAKRIGRRGESTFLEITLAEGKNREIRRMLAQLGHKVMQLRRVAIGPVRLGRLKRGKARRLSLPELEELKRIAHRNPVSPRNRVSRKPESVPRIEESR